MHCWLCYIRICCSNRSRTDTFAAAAAAAAAGSIDHCRSASPLSRSALLCLDHCLGLLCRKALGERGRNAALGVIGVLGVLGSRRPSRSARW